MKKIIALAALALLSFATFAQNGKSIYNKYSDRNGVSAVYISPAMFRMIGRIPEMEMGDNDVDITPIVKSLNGFYLLSADNADVSAELRRDVMRFVERGDYELLMEVKDDGDIVRMYTVGTEEEIRSFVLLVSEPDESTFICFDGRIPRKSFEALVSSQID